jgi:hypothetical protein
MELVQDFTVTAPMGNRNIKPFIVVSKVNTEFCFVSGMVREVVIFVLKKTPDFLVKCPNKQEHWSSPY